MKTRLLIGILLMLSATTSFGQIRSDSLAIAFDELSQSQPGLNEKVQINISGANLSDFISAIALEHNLNVSVDEQLDYSIVNNFYDAQVKDVFLFLVKKYNLEVEIIGSIISFRSKPEESPPPIKYEPKEIKVEYKPENQFLSLDLRQDSLSLVAEAITRKSKRNVILAPNIKNRLVSVYIENRPFDQVVEMMAKSNGLKATVDQNGFYYIELDEEATESQKARKSNSKNQSAGDATISVNPNDPNRLDIIATDFSISTLIELAADQLGEHYFMYDVPEGNTTLKVNNVTFSQLLAHILNGTPYTYRRDEDFYLIGNRNTEGLRATELIQLENRTIESVLEIIPADLLSDVHVKTFEELNGFIVSGSYLKIEELKVFLRSVDQVVPMVQIDIIIVYSNKSSQLSTGINAGIADQPVVTNGDIFPALDMTYSAESINGLIQAFNGFGIINIGAVTPNFYVSLKALESNSVIDITSTPKISTLNGHEATFSVGETSYYQETRIDYQPNLSGGNVLSNQVWKATEANLNITVKPFVSADEYVTLQISVQQDDFAGKVDPTAPPNKTTQTFESLIRVKNGEMILMGGLEKESNTDAGQGTPFLSRVPGLKWLFSSRDKEKEKSKLHVFIKPTVTY